MVKKTPEIQQELDKVDQQIARFEENIKEMTHDKMNEAPKQETEPQVKLSQSEIEKSNDYYLKPSRVIGCKEKFNEKFRDQYNFAKEYVQFIAENNETKDIIEIWTRPFPGVAAEYWSIPVNKPVWGPRYLAEQIKSKSYHRLVSEQSKVTTADGMGSYYGGLVVDKTIQRLDARPVSSKKSIFMGATTF